MRVEKNTIWAILVIFVSLFFLTWGNIRVEHKVYAGNISVSLEITTDRSAEMVDGLIYFKAEPGTAVQGTFSITNKEDEKRNIKLYPEGELGEKGWLSVSENDFILNPGERKPVEIIVKPPLDAKGNYTGRLRIENW